MIVYELLPVQHLELQLRCIEECQIVNDQPVTVLSISKQQIVILHAIKLYDDAVRIVVFLKFPDLFICQFCYVIQILNYRVRVIEKVVIIFHVTLFKGNDQRCLSVVEVRIKQRFLDGRCLAGIQEAAEHVNRLNHGRPLSSCLHQLPYRLLIPDYLLSLHHSKCGIHSVHS